MYRAAFKNKWRGLSLTVAHIPVFIDVTVTFSYQPLQPGIEVSVLTTCSEFHIYVHPRFLYGEHFYTYNRLIELENKQDKSCT